ncbi:uncharacterized protein LOC142350568 isoform X2 [Convolutriloba macropyga]|uniref:uncharacterized protein LOC142350568 isoform X2 n=1 Tax=Convolutriloba macropyga TaxID=536237 RepID=UPI003F528E8D
MIFLPNLTEHLLWSFKSSFGFALFRSSERSMYSTASMAVKAIKRRKRKEMEERRREKCEKALEIAVYAASPLCVVCATMAVIEGVTKLEECPIEPMIPVFALMFGCFSALIHTLTWIWYKFEYDTSMKGKSNRKMNWLELTLIVLHSILFIWILQGLFWTFYRIDELQLTVAALGNDAISELYCDCILYFVAVAFPLGHLLMVFLILLPKKL